MNVGQSLEGRAGRLDGDTERRGKKRSQGFREQRQDLSRRMNKCERHVGQGQEGSIPLWSIPAAEGAPGWLIGEEP